MVIGLIQAIPGIVFQILQWTVDLTSMAINSGGPSGNFYASDASQPLQAGIAAGFIVIVIVFIVISFIWNAAMIFAFPLVMEHDIGPIEAIKISVSAVFRNLGRGLWRAPLDVWLGLARVFARGRLRNG